MTDPDQDPQPEQYRVLSTEPVVIDPSRTLRRLRLAIILIGIAIVACAGIGGYVGYQLSASQLRSEVAALNASRATNRAQIQQTQAITQAQVEQGREVVCALIQRMRPDAELERDRKYYGCGPFLPPGDPGRQQVQAPLTPSPQPSS